MAELTTIEAIKTFAGISGTADDAVLATLLEAAEQAIRDYANRPSGWSQAVFVETLNGSGHNTLVVRNVPVAASPAPVVVLKTGASGTRTVDAGLYRFDQDTGEFRYIASGGLDGITGFVFGEDQHCPHGWPEGFQNIEVTYTGGYASIPATLAQAAILATLWMFYGRGRDPAMLSETQGAYAYTRWQAAPGQVLPPEVLFLLDPYRRAIGVPA